MAGLYQILFMGVSPVIIIKGNNVVILPGIIHVIASVAFPGLSLRAERKRSKAISAVIRQLLRVIAVLFRLSFSPRK
jgi:hypothetical protein